MQGCPRIHTKAGAGWTGKDDGERIVTADRERMSSITKIIALIAGATAGVWLSGCTTAPPASCSALTPEIIILSEEQRNPFQPTILKVSDTVEIERSEVKLICQGAALLSSNESALIEFFWEIDSDGDAFIGYNDVGD